PLARVSRPCKGLVRLAFDHCLHETLRSFTGGGFNRIEPIVGPLYSSIGNELRGCVLRGNTRHGVVALPGDPGRVNRG
ncbi:MAG: hypothetical protein ACRECE_11440, partial [Xanthobacteraceae bacterium]